jgi:hypothetical protein
VVAGERIAGPADVKPLLEVDGEGVTRSTHPRLAVWRVPRR